MGPLLPKGISGEKDRRGHRRLPARRRREDRKARVVGGHLAWQVFYRDERVLRNRIDDTTLLKPLIDGDLSTIQKITVNGSMVLPARLYCGQSLLIRGEW
jgi:hypothetical protein